MRLLVLLLPVYMIGLGFLCGLTQVTAVKPFQIRPYENSFNDRTPLSPLELARGHWFIEKRWHLNDLFTLAHGLQTEGHGRRMAAGQLLDERMANLHSYATFFQYDYLRYFRERHGDRRPTNPPLIVPPESLAQFDSIADRMALRKVPADVLMKFVNTHFPHQTSVELNNQIIWHLKANPNDEGLVDLNILHKAYHDAFAKYYLPRLDDSSPIFKSFEVLDFLADEDQHDEYQYVYNALKQAVEPYSDAASSSRQ